MNKAVMLLSLTLLGAGCAARSTDAPGKHVSHRAHSGPRANPHAHRGGHGCSHKARHKGYKHHTVHHSFADAERWAKKFEDPARDAWQKPEQVLAAMALKPEMLVGDIGASTGYFPVRLARAVPRGKVFGADIEPKMVAYLRQRAANEGLANLKTIHCKADDPGFPVALDRVLICNTYHHLEARTAYFKRLAARLKPGAWLVVVDFKLGQIPVGPPEKARIPPQIVTGELTAAGYKLVKLDRQTLPYQYIAIFSR